MANITVGANTTVVNVDSTTNNVSVSSTLSNIVVGEARFVANSTIREALSVTDTGGDGSLSYSNVSGVFTYTGPSATEVRAHLGNTLPITYDSATGVIGFDQNLDDLTLKKYQETVVANGAASGNVSVNITNGTVHQIDLGGDITGITLTNISTGGSATIFFTQDGIGGAVLDTTTHPSNWTDWKFTNGFTDFSTGANEWNALNVFYDGTDHYATLITETGATVQNSDLANSNVTFNGVTVELGSSGTITDFTSNVLIDANANITQALTVGGAIDATSIDASGANITGSASLGDTTLSKVTFSSSSAIIDGITNGSASSNINLDTNQVTVGRPLYTAGVLSESNIVSPGPMSLRGGEAIFLNNETEFLKIQSNIPDGVTPYIRSYAGFTGSGNANIYIDPLGSQTTDGGFRVLNNSNTTIFHVNTSGKATAEGNIETNSHLITNHITPLSNGNVEVAGNLNVQGNLNYVNVEDLLVNDQSITMNYGNVAQDAMIIVDRVGSGAGSNVELKWNETTDKWQFTNDGSTYYNLPASTSDLAEGTNLYYTDARFDTRLGTKSTTDLSEGTNLYYTQGRFDTAFTAKSTTDLSEGTNLYYTDGRFDTRLATKSTSDLSEGTNLYYTDARVQSKIDSYVLGSENITVTSGVLATTPALGNTNSLTAQSGSGLTFNSDDGTIVTSKFGVNSTVTETANIAGKGFGVFNFNDSSNTAIAYSGTDSFEWYILTGSTTAGSTTLTITSMLRGIDDTTAAVSDINVGQVISNGQNISFPTDAYVVSINSGAGTVEMSEPASFTNTFGTATTAGAFVSGVEYKIVSTGTTDFTLIGAADSNPGTTFTATGVGTGDGTALETNETILDAGLVDTTTGLVVTLQSDARTGGGSDSSLAARIFRNTPFGYPASGPVGTDFDIITTGSASDYSTTLTPFMMGQTPVTNNKTALNAPLGITIGENTQLTNRGENDIFKSFGMNMMWDGLDSDLIQPIQPQVLFKSYTDNSQQKQAIGSVGLAGGAPRLFFSTANGNADADQFDAYPRQNQELGRLSFWGSTGEQLNPSSYNVPAFISVGAADDWDEWQGATAGNTNVYMGATSNGSNPDTYLSYKSGELFLGGGNSQPVTLAPAHNGSASNPTNAYALSPTKWAEANYANTGVSSGAKFTVNNGGSVNAGTVGDMQLSLKRNDNSSTEDTNIRSIFSGNGLPFAENNAVMFTFDNIGTALNGKSATVSASGTITVSSTGNETGLAGQTYTLTYLFSSSNIDWYYVVGGGSGSGGRILYSDIGGTTPAEVFVPQTVPSTVTTVVSSGVTAKEWKFNLEEQSDNLLLQSDGVTKVEFTDATSVFSNRVHFQNLTQTEIEALTMTAGDAGATVFCTDSSPTATLCFYDGSAWQKVNHATL